MSVDDIRKRINAIDSQLLDLLDERAKLAIEVGRIKREQGRPMYDPERERDLLDRLEQELVDRPDPSFPRTSVRPVFREIISACLSVEQQLRVAVLGPAGTFTHMAARETFGLAVQYVEVPTIPGVFDAVERGDATYGVAPVENSTEGSVTMTLDELLESKLKIRQEVELDVTQCLVGRHTDLSRIERVYSHPQALAQCRAWLSDNLPRAQLVMFPSTTAAAREAATDDAAAAISSKLAAELYGLEVVREGIQDRSQNTTRFIVLADSDAPPTGQDKTSIVFSAADERGALKRVLEIFDEEGINLSRIESRPRGDKPWQYVFFTNLEGHRTEERVARALERLTDACEMVKVLGSYPATARVAG